ncbi:unnamed protein product [Angiostrongylus costaricensis]|uniref:Uncharacterized protein n=1 Tax=Angiostrongylus costaricensis TaxID=334426 RepID=A0A158PK71_ANGCS|nr:unnamed protein product [Angiostrongylus costaricensis]
MSVASASAYSLTDSDEMITVGMTTNASIQETDLQTALEDTNVVIDEATSERNLLDHDTHMQSNVKTAQMGTPVYTSSRSETDVDMEQDVVGAASPLSTAVTGSVSWYSLPPSETSVEVANLMEENQAACHASLIEMKALQCQVDHARLLPMFSLSIVSMTYLNIFTIEIGQEFISRIRPKQYG